MKKTISKAQACRLGLDLEILGRPEAAAYLGYTREYLRIMVRDGYGPYHFVKSGHYLYVKSALDEWRNLPGKNTCKRAPVNADTLTAAANWLSEGELKALGLSTFRLVPGAHKAVMYLYHVTEVQPQLEKKRLRERPLLRLQANSTVDPVTGCWDWNSPCDPNGYGRLRYKGGTEYIHRIAYLETHGAFPEDKPFACHKCNNAKCCNPEHIYAGSAQDNVDDRTASGNHQIHVLSPEQIKACGKAHTPEQKKALEAEFGVSYSQIYRHYVNQKAVA